jgi:hypothetical protein
MGPGIIRPTVFWRLPTYVRRKLHAIDAVTGTFVFHMPYAYFLRNISTEVRDPTDVVQVKAVLFS